MSNNRSLLDSAAGRLARLVRDAADLSWFQRFFGPRPTARLVLVPGTCNDGASYGPRYEGTDGTEELYAIVGAEQVDSGGWPLFTKRTLPFVVHEFNHSFVNPELDAASAQFETSGPVIYRAVAEDLRRQAYGDWRTTLNESLVRAAAARYALAVHGPEVARAAVRDEIADGFVWTDEVFVLLGQYEQQRTHYPTFRSFVPEIAAYFKGLAARIDDVVAAFEARRPRIIATAPRNGDTAVSGALETITFRFDRPMSRGYSINTGLLGRAGYPYVAGQDFDSTRTTFTLHVRLEPGHEYEMVLTGSGFRTMDGVPLRETWFRFRTATAKQR